MERPLSGQAEPVLRGEPQRVRLGAHHHTPRALKRHSPCRASHADVEDDEKKVKELSFQPEVSGAFPSHTSGLRGCGCVNPLRCILGRHVGSGLPLRKKGVEVQRSSADTGQGGLDLGPESLMGH